VTSSSEVTELSGASSVHHPSLCKVAQGEGIVIKKRQFIQYQVINGVS
jgi:hypothetical protein